MPAIENPTDLDQLCDVKRFFIFGDNKLGDRVHLLLVGRYPTRFYGFLVGEPTNERHRESQYSLLYWENALARLEAGDLVFMAKRSSRIEGQLVAEGIRIARPQLLTQIYGTYETPTMLHFCKTYIKKKGIALDIGGNTGLTGAMLSSFSEHVHIFEANPEMESSIQATNEGNANITLHMKAVAQTTGSISLYSAGGQNMSMVPKEKSEPIVVPSVSVDDFCRDHSIKPTVMKIDVEGVDGEVILGAKTTISNGRPWIFFEHPLHMAGTYDTSREIAAEAMSFLAEIYDLFAFPHFGQLFSARALNMPLAEFITEFKTWPTNVAAVPKS